MTTASLSLLSCFSKGDLATIWGIHAGKGHEPHNPAVSTTPPTQPPTTSMLAQRLRAASALQQPGSRAHTAARRTHQRSRSARPSRAAAAMATAEYTAYVKGDPGANKLADVSAGRRVWRVTHASRPLGAPRAGTEHASSTPGAEGHLKLLCPPTCHHPVGARARAHHHQLRVRVRQPRLPITPSLALPRPPVLPLL
jgi:hypothetical protein